MSPDIWTRSLDPFFPPLSLAVATVLLGPLQSYRNQMADFAHALFASLSFPALGTWLTVLMRAGTS